MQKTRSSCLLIFGSSDYVVINAVSDVRWEKRCLVKPVSRFEV